MFDMNSFIMGASATFIAFCIMHEVREWGRYRILKRSEERVKEAYNKVMKDKNLLEHMKKEQDKGGHRFN